MRGIINPIMKLTSILFSVFLFSTLLIPVSSSVFAQNEIGNPGAGEIGNPGSTNPSTQPNGENSDISFQLENPLSGVNTISDFVKKILDIVLTIGIPIVALAIIYSGFLFVAARGNTEKLGQAKKTFLYTIIGAAILLGAWLLAQVLSETITQLSS
jgi:hypothetical protein